MSLSAAALKCRVRDRWIGWDLRTQHDRLKSIVNNSRFLILPEGRWPNVGSRVLGLAAGGMLCGMRGYKATADWVHGLGQAARARFGCRRVGGATRSPAST